METTVQTISKEERDEILRDHVLQRLDIGDPGVYVGTYAKYNNGSIEGAWLNLTTFKSYDEFIEVAEILHNDEKDPELMIQDYSDFPEKFYSESPDEDKFESILKYIELCEKNDQEAVDAYLEWFDDLESFEEKYEGEYDDEKDFAEHLINDLYNFQGVPEILIDYFDYERFAEEIFKYDYVFENGYVFLNC